MQAYLVNTCNTLLIGLFLLALSAAARRKVPFLGPFPLAREQAPELRSMGAGGPFRLKLRAPKGMLAAHPALRPPICDMRLGL